MNQVTNPYIAGPPVGGNRLIGRESIIREIVSRITPPDPTPLVIRGEPRIGKSSVLQEVVRRLKKSSEHNYHAILIIPSGYQPPSSLEDFIFNLSDSIQSSFSNDQPIKKISKRFSQKTFIESFLPKIFDTTKCSQIILIFDSLEGIIDSLERAPQSGITLDVVQFLKILFERESRLIPIFNVGSRNLDSLRSPLRDLFGSSHSIVIKTLPIEETKELITSPAESLLQYKKDAIINIWKLTQGHPYFTQLICTEIYNFVFLNKEDKRNTKRIIDEQIIDENISNAVLTGDTGINPIWNSYNLTQQLLLSALASLHEPNRSFISNPSVMQKILNSHSDMKKLNFAEELIRLKHRQVLSEHSDNDGNRSYRFHVDLFRMWISEKKSFDKFVNESINSEYLNRVKECEGLGTLLRELNDLRREMEIRAAKFGLNVPLDIFAQLNYCNEKIREYKQKLEIFNCREMMIWVENGNFLR